tara:strand:+ start:181 stop:303 length:123 start_codon:yes stop_codon:yes gene_type:complete
MVPHALDALGRRAVTSGDGGNHSKLKEPLSGTILLPIQFQ